MQNRFAAFVTLFLISSAVAAPSPKSTCPAQPSDTNSDPSWVRLSDLAAQCTDAALKRGDWARVKTVTFPKDSEFKIERLPWPRRNIVQKATRSHPLAAYIGNGPIFMKYGFPGGYLRSNGRTIWSLDCVKYKTNPGNIGKENSVFLRYHSPKTPEEWTYRVISTDLLCTQLSERMGPSNDLSNETQIDFAIQSGPGVLRDGENLLADYTGATCFRSYIGVNGEGEPVIVEADGKISSFCMGEYLQAQGIRELLHRDSYISDAAFRENSAISGYPSKNKSAEAAALLIITPSP